MTNSLDRKIERAAARAAEERAEAERFRQPRSGLTDPNEPESKVQQGAETAPAQRNETAPPAGLAEVDEAAGMPAVPMLTLNKIHAAPPIGLMPATLFYTQRRDAVRAAIERYNEAGLQVPDAWLAEIAELESLEIPLQPPGHSPSDAMVGLELLKRSMQHDPDYARTWLDNLACVVMDTLAHLRTESGGLRFSVRYDTAQEVARRFMALAFEIKDDRPAAVPIARPMHGGYPDAAPLPDTRERALAELRAMSVQPGYLGEQSFQRIKGIVAKFEGMSLWTQRPSPEHSQIELLAFNIGACRGAWVMVLPLMNG